MDTLSTFIIEDNGGHDVLELELRKTFYLSKNVHCDMFGQSAKPRGIFGQNIRHFLASNRGGWPADLELELGILEIIKS